MIQGLPNKHSSQNAFFPAPAPNRGSLFTSIGCIIAIYNRIVHIFSKNTVKKRKLLQFNGMVAKPGETWPDGDSQTHKLLDLRIATKRSQYDGLYQPAPGREPGNQNTAPGKGREQPNQGGPLGRDVLLGRGAGGPPGRTETLSGISALRVCRIPCPEQEGKPPAPFR